MSKATGSNTGVFVGCFGVEYRSVILKDPEIYRRYLATGSSMTMLANRLSWFYDLHGPSISLDTACSSSLIACHLAVNSLRSGESDMVGGGHLLHKHGY
jgi:acyl transferase domain-containing protein